MFDIAKNNHLFDSIQIADVVWLASVIGDYGDGDISLGKAAGNRPDIDHAVDNDKPKLPKKEIAQPKMERAIQEPGKASNVNKMTSLHAMSNHNNDSNKKGLPIRTPGVSTSNYLSIARSFKSLRLKNKSKGKKRLDVDFVVEYLAETGFFQPFYKESTELYWEVYVVVDISQSMLPWQKYLDGLLKVLEHNGSFRTVKSFFIDADQKDFKLYPSKSKTRPSKPSEFFSYSKKRIILLVSDCVSLAWHNSSILNDFILPLQKTEIVSILQMLPRTMWPGTALSKGHDVVFHNDRKLIQNSMLLSEDDWQWEDECADFYKISSTLAKIPIITTAPESIRNWGYMLSGKSGQYSYGRVFDSQEFAEFTAASNDSPLSAEESVDILYAQTSTSAQILAEYLSAFTVVSMSLIRLVQELLTRKSVLTESTQLQVAEVLLSRLFEKIDEDASGPIYSFKEGVREVLNDSLGKSDENFIRQEVGRFIIKKFGQSVDYWALLHDPNLFKGLSIPKQDKGFANIARFLFDRSNENDPTGQKKGGAVEPDATPKSTTSSSRPDREPSMGDSQGNSIYCLFVGINQYEYHSPSGRDINLYGCVNDVNLISGLLQERYDISEKQSLILLNEQASKQNIVNGFRDHLAKAGKDDTAIFYFSGHGSTEKTDPRMWISERDHRNETLVCHDSRTSKQPYDLADKELRYLIYQLSKKGVNIVTIIDSSHRGYSTRYLEGDQEEVLARQIPSSNESRPLDSYIFFEDPQAQVWINDFSKMPEGDHIAFSACRDDQSAKEVSVNRRNYGVFSYNFHHALQSQLLSPSYHNLINLTVQRIAIRGENQTPQLNSIGQRFDIHQTFLFADLQPMVYLVSYYEGAWWLNAGIAQGVNLNAHLTILPGDGDVVEATVVEVSPTYATEHISRLAVTDLTVLDQKIQYQSYMTDSGVAPLPISLDGSSSHIHALMEMIESSDSRYYLSIDETAEYVLVTSETEIVFNRRHGLPLDVSPVQSIEGNPPREWIALQLAIHMAEWEHNLSLVYALREDSMPSDLIRLNINQYNPISESYIELNHDTGAFDLYYHLTANGESKKPKIKLSVSMNGSANWNQDEDIFISLLFLDPIEGSTHILANHEVLRNVERIGENRVTKPACPVWNYSRIIKGQRKETITFSVPDRLLEADGSGCTSDYLKLIISNFAIDISSLAQSSLSKVLERLNPSQSRGSKSIDFEDDISIDSDIIRGAMTQTYKINIVKKANSETYANEDSLEAVNSRELPERLLGSTWRKENGLEDITFISSHEFEYTSVGNQMRSKNSVSFDLGQEIMLLKWQHDGFISECKFNHNFTAFTEKDGTRWSLIAYKPFVHSSFRSLDLDSSDE